MAMPMHEALGVLTRELGVRIINVSVSGCLIETPRRMEVGTVGTLRLRVGNEGYSDTVQVVRCQPIAGAGSMYHVGMKFLSTAPRHAGSIRYAVRSPRGGDRGARIHPSDRMD
jgi:hypothetical protein